MVAPTTATAESSAETSASHAIAHWYRQIVGEVGVVNSQRKTILARLRELSSDLADAASGQDNVSQDLIPEAGEFWSDFCMIFPTQGTTTSGFGYIFDQSRPAARAVSVSRAVQAEIVLLRNDVSRLKHQLTKLDVNAARLPAAAPGGASHYWPTGTPAVGAIRQLVAAAASGAATMTSAAMEAAATAEMRADTILSAKQAGVERVESKCRSLL
jgi:hypothetical protein